MVINYWEHFDKYSRSEERSASGIIFQMGDRHWGALTLQVEVDRVV